MIGYARLTPGPGFRPLGAFFYYTQRLVTAAPARRAISAVIATVIRLWQGGRFALAADPVSRKVVSTLKSDGLAVVTDIAGADPDRIERIARFFRETPVLGPDGALVHPDHLPPGTAAAAYPMETVLRCQDVLDLINSPAMLRIAAQYLGCTPTLSSLGVRWSFPSGTAPSDTQQFHRDLDDWQFVKLFIYLTNVDAEAGPHVYVLGSHKTAAKIRAERYDGEGLEKRYGPNSLKTVLGPRGTAFIAATSGIHKGVPPLSKPRLILQAQYSLLPVFAFRYRPVTLPVQPLVDAYVNRLLIANSFRTMHS
jgi:hypothetical protein